MLHMLLLLILLLLLLLLKGSQVDWTLKHMKSLHILECTFTVRARSSIGNCRMTKYTDRSSDGHERENAGFFLQTTQRQCMHMYISISRV